MEEHFVGQVTQKAVLKFGEAFILVKEKDENNWILPGGRLNVREDPEAGLLREVKEELGIDCRIERIISTTAYHGDGPRSKTPKFFVYYLATALAGQNIQASNEIGQFVLIQKKEELTSYEMMPEQKSILREFLK